MKKFRFFTMAAMVISLLVSSVVCYAATSFTDIKSINWAYSYVNKLVEKGGIKGYPDGSFKPNNTITNAEFIKIVIGCSIQKDIAKTDTHWASGYMQTALDKSILADGMLTREQWDKPITREFVAYIVTRTAERIYEEDIFTGNVNEMNEKVIKQIKDYNDIGGFFKDYVVSAYDKYLIAGYPDGTFGGQKTITRAEASAIILRLIDKTYRVTPTTEKKISDLISNKEFMEDLANIDTYEYDETVGEYDVQIVENNGYKFLKVTNLYSIGLIKDGKIIERFYTMPSNLDGTVRAWEPKTDMTTVEYIISYDPGTEKVTVIPNPLHN